MKVGIPREVHQYERRVAITPASVARLRKLGVEVLVQSSAGQGASFSDDAYVEAGAEIVADADTLWQKSDLVLKVRPPGQDEAAGVHEVDRMREGGKYLGFCWPAQNPDLIKRFEAKKATVFGMDCVPRTSRAQKLDCLSAMANIVGYRAVLEASTAFGRFFPGQITAAGRVKPAHVLIVGAGVAGLAAIGVARGLGAVVRAFDTRPVVREQIESLGASFVEFKFDESGEGVGGYAKEMSAAYLEAEQALLAKHAAEVDIIITTALIPGKPAPKLITAKAIESMKPGSVLVDLAAEQGGNCELTVPNESVVRHGVTLVGYTDLASRMAPQASELYAGAILNLLEEIIDKDGQIKLDLEDEIHRGVLVVQDGNLMWPPPPPKPAAAPAKPAPAAAQKAPAEAAKPKAPEPTPVKASSGGHGGHGGHGAAASSESSLSGKIGALLLTVLLALAGAFASTEFLQHLTVFLLACVVGWHVVWNVTAALHTPLMSVTNAISGIILLGGMLVVSPEPTSLPTVLGLIAIVIASINVAGGFLVTQRMLKMFHR